MATPMQVFVFGDQTFDACNPLSELLLAHDDVVLHSFLESSCRVLKQEVASLRHEQEVACPRFASLADLVTPWREGILNPALIQALTCICHIGTFLHGHVSGGHGHPTARNACITARCTGLISSIAVGCSSNPVEIASLGRHAVAVAFRVGACAWDVGSRLQPLQDEQGIYSPWTMALAGIDEDELMGAIDRFAAEKSLGPLAMPYVSARIAPSRFSVSAPPRVLGQLFAESSLSRYSAVPLPITAPYHAEHLYGPEHVSLVLRDVPDFRPSATIPVISSSTGESICLTTYRDALRSAVEACLKQTIRWDLVPAGIAAQLHNTDPDGSYVIRHVTTAPDGLGVAVHNALGRLGSQIDHSPLLDRAPCLIPPAAGKARDKIAILSMAGRFPRAPSMDAFWHVLEHGIDTHELAPASRWNTSTHVGDASALHMAKNISGTGFGCWLHDAGLFDARFFNMSPREAPQVDPAQRLALLTAAEALEQAGIVPGRTSSTQKDRIGVYFGSTSNDWMETNSAQDIDTYFIPGGNRAFIPGRINYHFKFSGPSYTIDTACSSSLSAIHLACNALWKGEVDTAIVGGTNVLTNPDMTAGLDRGHFLSRTGNCKTFDDTADGYCRGEAVATAVLKRLSDAVADKDPIQACILAIQTNHSAEADSITRPHVGAQQALFENLLLQAGVKAKEITYCEMHGTGTQAGDASEAMSVLQTLAPEAPTKAARSAHERLWIGAAKSNVGHGEAAAGVTSLAKVLLMLKHSTIPPHCGIKTKINHKLPDLAARNVSVATASVQWPRPYPGGGVRKVLLNNFSAAGGNTALILEDAPASSTPNQVDTRLDHVIAVSAKTPASLENNLKNLAEWIEAQQSSDPLVLPRLSYTTTARRIHHPHRVMVLASDLESASASLRRSLERKEGSSRAKGSPRYLFAFTGQGAHYAGMGVDLYSQYSGFRDDIRCYNRICLQLQLPPIQQLFESLSAAYADATPTTLQLASVCFQMALYRLWVSLGVRPSVVVGHSLGEFAALYAASVLSQVDVISLVGRRAQLLEQFCDQGSHAMLAVRTDLSRLESFVGSPGSHYEVSCLNGHENVVLGGTKAQMDAVRRPLVKRGISHTFLEVPYAYHTSQVEPILASLQLAATGIEFREPKISLISPTYGRVITRSDDLGPDFFVRHCRDKVDMLGALKAAKATNFINEGMVGVEIGPALVVTKMVKEVAGAAFRSFPSCRSGTDSARLLAQALAAFYTAGAKIDWMTYHTDFASSQQVLDLPSYSWDLKEYWIQYVHDWSLRKGEPPLQIEQPALESSSIHRIVQHTASAKGGELVVEADLSRIDLHPMVQGHKVYGVPLCTPSVYADIAFTIGKYLKRYFEHDGKVLSIDIADMNIQSALVANSDGKPQLLRTFASLNPETKSISCTFSSVDDKDKVTEQHSTCLVKFFDTDQARCSLKANASRIKARIASLEHQLSKFGNTFRYSKAMIYKMVGQLADFDPNYRALEEIILDSDMYEAVGRVNFTEVLDKGSFHTNPAYIDALSQLGGFVMNGNNSVDLDKELFVNHGWRSLQLLEAIDSQKIYTTHVKMVQGKDKLWHGDITIFHNDDVIGIFAGVALQGVPKRLMQYIVSSASKRVTGLAGKEPMSQSAQQVVPPQASSIVTKTATKLIEHRRPAKSVTATKAVQIISDESGVSVADLTDETRFDDVGVDSLLSLVVTSRIRDELGIDFDSTVFFDLHTVSDFKNFLLGLDHPLENSVTEAETIHEVSIPINIKGVYTDREDIIADIWTSALNIIAEESGIDIAELNGDTSFSDIGVDSLLSLVVCSRMRDELNVDVPDRSLFLDFPTIGDLRDKITSGSVTPSTSDISTSNSNTFSVGFTEDLQSVSANMEILDQMALSPIQPAWSITLQGSSRRASERLFLFPDGCGAATSYLNLPSIAPTTAVIGFNSPFMKTPLEMRDRQLSEIVTSYVGGVRKHQPHGPYHLAGWSAGGILAYAISQELMVAGEEVASLTLIDSPPPNNGLDRLPRRFFDHCSKVGIFGTEMDAIARQNGQSAENPKLPEWLMPHFEATIELLHDYHAPPMPRNLKGPGKVNIIWAGSCAFGGQYAPLPPALFDSEDTEGMKFLTEQRTDFGPGDWALLFPERNITVDIVQGHHHFSMMRGSGGEQLGHFIRRTLGMVT